MTTLASGGGHPPLQASSHTSTWFALRYVKEHVPHISVHDLIRLVASVGAETHGEYTFQSLHNAVTQYQHDGSFPSQRDHTGKDWKGYVGSVILAAKRHGHKDWVSGFGYTSKDVPGSGGPSTIQQIADSGAGNAVVNAGSAVGSAFGDLFGGIGKHLVVVLVILLIVVLVARR